MGMQQELDALLDFGDGDLDLPSHDPNQAQRADHQLSMLADFLNAQQLPASDALSHQNQEALFDFAFESAYSQQSLRQQTQPQDYAMQLCAFLPPTPHSTEMHGDALGHLDHMDSQTDTILEQRFRLHTEDPATFTPLVSPAVTPHGSAFQTQPRFMAPSAYFSPLTSPALDAQNNGSWHYPHHDLSATKGPVTISPIDLDVTMSVEQARRWETGQRSKSKGSAPLNQSSVSSGRNKQSPIVEPQGQTHRRKGSPDSIIPSSGGNGPLGQTQQRAVPSRPISSHPRTLESRKGSEAESITPTPLSEPSMGQARQACPATPASLMRLQPPSQDYQSISGGFTLPQPTAEASHRLEPKSAGRVKKRGSVSSSLASPALRPRISPSIKPLLQKCTSTSEDAHTLLLTSKSNYQHIIEGTQVPGIVYPRELSTNLTSKRALHKIAEKGRRNRINLALQELQALIPSPNVRPDESVQKEDRQYGSKAITVENAIEYIKLLLKRGEESDRAMEEQKKEIGELRQRLTGCGMTIDQSGQCQPDDGKSERVEPSHGAMPQQTP